MLVKQLLSILEDTLTLDKLATFLPLFVLEFFFLFVLFLCLLLLGGFSCCHQVSNDLGDNTDKCQAHIGGEHSDNDKPELCVFSVGLVRVLDAHAYHVETCEEKFSEDCEYGRYLAFEGASDKHIKNH
jgi:hypothetical protein